MWDVLEYKWNIGFNHLKAHIKEHGDARVIKGYKNDEGFALANWVKAQRGNLKKG